MKKIFKLNMHGKKLKNIGGFPKRLYKPIREKIRKISRRRAELKSIDEAEISGEIEAKKIIKKRFIHALVVSEIVGTFIGAPLVGSLFQYTSGSAYKGILGTMIGDYFPALVSFTVYWYMLNRKFYSIKKSFFDKAKQLAKDIGSFLKIDLIAVPPAYLIGGTLSAIYVRTAEFFSEKIAHGIPVSLITEPLNYIAAEATYIYLVLKFIDKALAGFNSRYCNYLEKTFSSESDEKQPEEYKLSA